MQILTVVALTLLSAVGTNHRIVPGTRIGKVRLNHKVPAVLSQPNFSDGAAGHIWSTWKGATGNTLDTFEVIGGTEGHECKLVRVTSPKFRTSGGIRTGQTWGHIRAFFPGVVITTYQSKQFARKLAILDNRTKGISFEVTVNAAGNVTYGSRCKAIWVHEAGVAIDPSTWVIYQTIRP